MLKASLVRLSKIMPGWLLARLPMMDTNRGTFNCGKLWYSSWFDFVWINALGCCIGMNYSIFNFKSSSFICQTSHLHLSCVTRHTSHVTDGGLDRVHFHLVHLSLCHWFSRWRTWIPETKTLLPCCFSWKIEKWKWRKQMSMWKSSTDSTVFYLTSLMKSYLNKTMCLLCQG